MSVTHKGNFAFVEMANAEMADDAIREVRQNTQMKVSLAYQSGPGGAGGFGGDRFDRKDGLIGRYETYPK